MKKDNDRLPDFEELEEKMYKDHLLNHIIEKAKCYKATKLVLLLVFVLSTFSIFYSGFTAEYTDLKVFLSVVTVIFCIALPSPELYVESTIINDDNILLRDKVEFIEKAEKEIKNFLI